jgi:putative flippase GtrA
MRIVKFSLVGAVGIGVQLALLAALTGLGMYYLTATAFGVEAAILHNFCWHQLFTWRDRESSGWVRRLLRFHASNGVISLAGNLVVMRALVGMGMSVVTANVVAIGACALANYAASDLWVFAIRPTKTEFFRP